MIIRILQIPRDLAHYEEWLSAHPHPTLWQSLAWKRYQEALGRETRIYTVENERQDIIASALVIVDRTAFGLSTWDIPRGPLEGVSSERLAVSTLLRHILDDAQKEKCMTLYVSPLSQLKAQSLQLKTSPRHEQPEATRILDLTLSDEELLAQMHPKGRYNIHVAEKHEVRVDKSNDIDAFYELLTSTAGRDRFTVGPKRQYEMFLRELPGAFLLMAHTGDELSVMSDKRTDSEPKAHSSQLPIAGLLGVIHGLTGIYYYGASSYEHRALMAPFLLQWEAMKLCRARGARFYDLLGVAPEDAGPEHPWSGISAFKAKFGGQVVTYPPEQQIVLRPLVNTLLRLKRSIMG